MPPSKVRTEMSRVMDLVFIRIPRSEFLIEKWKGFAGCTSLHWPKHPPVKTASTYTWSCHRAPARRTEHGRRDMGIAVMAWCTRFWSFLQCGNNANNRAAPQLFGESPSLLVYLLFLK